MLYCIDPDRQVASRSNKKEIDFLRRKGVYYNGYGEGDLVTGPTLELKKR